MSLKEVYLQAINNGGNVNLLNNKKQNKKNYEKYFLYDAVITCSSLPKQEREF